jgi:hypothetical protein
MYDEDAYVEGVENFLKHEGILKEDESLVHAGVKGMKWGQRKARTAASAGTSGFFNKPSAAKALVVNSYGRKSSYTNARALQKRTSAGKLRIAALLTGASAVAISAVGRGNPGATVVAGLLGTTAGGLGVASVVQGTTGAALESESRRG